MAWVIFISVYLFSMIFDFRCMALTDKYYVLAQKPKDNHIYRGDMFHSNGNKSLADTWYFMSMIHILNMIFLIISFSFYIGGRKKYKKHIREEKGEIRTIKIFSIDVIKYWNMWTLKNYM